MSSVERPAGAGALPEDWALERRTGLPDALAALAAETPRTDWPAHAEFDRLARFWMERHLMFRRLTDILQQEAQAALDDAEDMPAYAARLPRYAGMLLGGLEEHHSVEDHHYFPMLRVIDARLARGFDLLDADHHRLHAGLSALASAARRVIDAPARDPAAALLAELDGFAPLLERHLEDEEDLIVPVILRAKLA